LVRKLEYLRQQLDTLEPYRSLGKLTLLENREKVLAVERLLELSIQSVMDLSRLLVLVRDWSKERDAMTVLAEHRIIKPELADRLLKAKGFRNVLVHDYVEIEPDLLFDYLKEDVSDLWAFVKALAAHLHRWD
jgi:uncharacterized protein YutE (UPF0331/DUF86 family)